ncbi:unnamed protein product [Darwinula stevensoni]|uniref:Uncharacterized protein n=1 Tax=Darwinula stevensoni TaxID=69355 RepID=A0A7R9FQS5_9CRUS|nr:unnamed protein product [Darwinula stevensoni]CAG0900054.1 unnamed protein product [Darwinula stevensoni]
MRMNSVLIPVAGWFLALGYSALVSDRQSENGFPRKYESIPPAKKMPSLVRDKRHPTGGRGFLKEDNNVPSVSLRGFLIRPEWIAQAKKNVLRNPHNFVIQSAADVEEIAARRSTREVLVSKRRFVLEAIQRLLRLRESLKKDPITNARATSLCKSLFRIAPLAVITRREVWASCRQQLPTPNPAADENSVVLEAGLEDRFSDGRLRNGKAFWVKASFLGRGTKAAEADSGTETLTKGSSTTGKEKKRGNAEPHSQQGYARPLPRLIEFASKREGKRDRVMGNESVTTTFNVRDSPPPSMCETHRHLQCARREPRITGWRGIWPGEYLHLPPPLTFFYCRV